VTILKLQHLENFKKYKICLFYMTKKELSEPEQPKPRQLSVVALEYTGEESRRAGCMRTVNDILKARLTACGGPREITIDPKYEDRHIYIWGITSEEANQILGAYERDDAVGVRESMGSMRVASSSTVLVRQPNGDRPQLDVLVKQHEVETAGLKARIAQLTAERETAQQQLEATTNSVHTREDTIVGLKAKLTSQAEYITAAKRTETTLAEAQTALEQRVRRAEKENAGLHLKIAPTHSSKEAILRHMAEYASTFEAVSSLIGETIFKPYEREIKEVSGALRTLGVPLSTDNETGILKAIALYLPQGEETATSPTEVNVQTPIKQLYLSSHIVEASAAKDATEKIKALQTARAALASRPDAFREYIARLDGEIAQEQRAVLNLDRACSEYQQRVQETLKEGQRLLRESAEAENIKSLVAQEQASNLPLLIELLQDDTAYSLAVYHPRTKCQSSPLVLTVLGEHVFSEKVVSGLDAATLSSRKESISQDGSVQEIAFTLPKAKYSLESVLALAHQVETSLFEGFQHTQLPRYGISLDVCFEIQTGNPAESARTTTESPAYSPEKPRLRRKRDWAQRERFYQEILPAHSEGYMPPAQILERLQERRGPTCISVVYRDMRTLVEEGIAEINSEGAYKLSPKTTKPAGLEQE
jgi:hypothetical protein